MLQAKGISKTYKPKKGPAVKALDEVSLTLEDKGLVFILGKSGSGKSTLLNVLGGLDSCDSGEVIIKGRTSKDFSQPDFDSYRNTFIGFIFQEYNILDEFTVGQNIALAIELQGRKATSEMVTKILDEVDLTGYAHRKPNELSGGQKQRVAIARALIKEPEIIMADEPTGALDSNTGKMVFDTLKKLSKEKLVIVVSHDREFAEQYGDRVIELADGKIISDIYKYTVPPEAKSKGIDIYGKLLHIKKGYTLTDEDVKLINDYIKKNSETDSDVIISLDGETNKEVKKFTRIDDDGNSEAFRNTKDEQLAIKKYDSNLKLIRSRLPVKNAFKIGASGLKTKPFRLFMTILLSAIAFSFFGISLSAAAYNKVTATLDSMQDSNIRYVAIAKENVLRTDDNSYTGDAYLNSDDIAVLSEKFPDVDFVPVFVGSQNSSNPSYSSNLGDVTKIIGSTGMGSFYQPSLSGVTVLTQEQINDFGYELTGRLPEAKNEIVLTQYAFDIFKLCGYVTYPRGAEVVTVDSFDDMRDKEVYLNISQGAINLKVVGILDTHLDSSRYSSFLPNSTNSNDNYLNSYMLQNELSVVLQYSLHSVGIVHQSLMEELTVSSKHIVLNDNFYSIRFSPNEYNENQYDHSTYYCNGLVKNTDIEGGVVYFDENKSTLADNELLITLDSLKDMLYVKYPNTSGDMVPQIEAVLSNAVRAGFDAYITDDIALKYFAAGYDLISASAVRFYLGDGEYNLKEGTDQYVVDENGLYSIVDYEREPSEEGPYYTYADGGKWQFILIAEAQIYGQDENYTYVLDPDGSILKIGSSYHHFDRNRYNKSPKYGINGEGGYRYIPPEYEYVGSGGSYIMGIDHNQSMSLLMEYMLNDGYFTNEYTTQENGLLPGKALYPTFLASGIKECLEQSMSLDPSTVYMWVDNRIINETQSKSYSVVGIYVPNSYQNGMYALTSDAISSIGVTAGGSYSCIVGNMPSDEKLKRALVEYTFEDGIEQSNYVLKNSVMVSIDGIGSYIENFTTVFLYIAIGFAVFASFLLMNFIATSISYKKREIGILRAVGARSADVVGIFFNESLIIALINFLFSILGTGVAVYYLNQMLKREFNLPLTILHFGLLQIIALLAVAVVVAFLASAIPVFRTARKKPIDAIRQR